MGGLDLSEEKKPPMETLEGHPGKYEGEIHGCLRKFVNICKIKDCQKCAWRVHNARLQKRKNIETDDRIKELKNEKDNLEKQQQEGTKRFKWIAEELEELQAMKRPVKDPFADSDESDSELVQKVEKPFRRERSFDLEKVRALFGMGPEPPRNMLDPETPRTDRKRYLEVESDVLSEYQMLQISASLEKLAWSKPVVADRGQLTYRDIENALSGTSGKLTRRRCERVFEKLCLQQRAHAAWEKNVKVDLRSIRVDQRKDTVRLSSWYRAVEQGAVLTDYGIDTDEVVEFTYAISEKANKVHLDSLCLGVSLRPAVLRYDTAGSTLVCLKAKSKTRAGPDFFVFGESMLSRKDCEPPPLPTEIKAGDQVTFRLDRRASPDGFFMGSLSVTVNPMGNSLEDGGETVELIGNLAEAGIKKDEVYFPMAYAALPPAEVRHIAKVTCVMAGLVLPRWRTMVLKVLSDWDKKHADVKTLVRKRHKIEEAEALCMPVCEEAGN